MDPEDFISPEVGVTAAVVAVVASPQVRKVVRRGAVLGVAGVLMAGDAITSFARGLGQGVNQGAQRVAQQMQGAQNGKDTSNDSVDDGAQPVHQGEAQNVGEPS